MDNILFTPAAVLELLVNIDELKNSSIGISEGIDGNIILQIDDATYEIPTESMNTISVDSKVSEQVEEVNQDAYDDLTDTYETEISSDIESGVLKHIAKSLLLGGMIRLSSKLLK